MVHLRIGPLVRSVSDTSAVIWAEVTGAGIIQIEVSPLQAIQTDIIRQQTATIKVGNHFYVALHINNLTPTTWYSYTLQVDSSPLLFADQKTLPRCCFHTFCSTQAATDLTPNKLRIAYGSCRKSDEQQTDPLDTLGHWLIDHFEERDTQWPHALLLIGDQIYADEPPHTLRVSYPELQHGAIRFEDFTKLYEYAWTQQTGVRQALAALPTYMIFDDHEITNNWNFEPTWRAKALQSAQKEVLIDGLLAYWLYQGWGNILHTTDTQHPLLEIMREGERSGEDIIERLRACIEEDIYGRTPLPWHYTIATQPEIFVCNTRTERTSLLEGDKGDKKYDATRIVSQQQMHDLQKWLATNKSGMTLLVSSVPALLPPAIGFLEYLAGQRRINTKSGTLGWLGRQLAKLQMWVAMKTSFDHWPVYNITWHELVQALLQQKQDVLILSGDVHFSYAIQATGMKDKATKIYQFVSTPLQNELHAKDLRKIHIQARIAKMTYGGLQTRMLPLQVEPHSNAYQNLLFENTIAFVELQPDQAGDYTPQQWYMGTVQQQLKQIAKTKLL